MDKDNQKITERICHLLAIAQDDKASTNEREIAMKQATRLMVRHGITSINPSSTENDSEITETTMTLKGGYGTATRARWHGLFKIVVEAGCSAYCYDSRRIHNEMIVKIVATRADHRWLDHLLTLVDSQALLSWKQYRKQHPEIRSYTRHEQNKARDSFLIGFMQAVALATAEARETTLKEEHEAGSGKDIVVLDRAARVKHYMDTLEETMSFRRMRNIKLRGDSYREGVAQGEQSGLGRNQSKVDATIQTRLIEQ